MQITANNVTKTYGSVPALNGLSLEIPSGSTFGVLGTNGAGKTTFFKLLVGLDRPDTGHLSIDGQDVSQAGRALRTRVGYLPERVGFPPALTGREILEFHAEMRNLSGADRIHDAIEMVGLAPEDADRAVAGYSNGMRRRLGLAAAVLPRPPVLVLDEPTAGLDPKGVAEFHGIIDTIRTETGATVVVSSHVLSEVERLCDHVALFNDGEAVANGPIDDFIDTSTVTVRLRPATADQIETVLLAGNEYGTTTETNGTIDITCPANSVPALFGDLDSNIDIQDVTVERDGLEAAFHRALEGVSA